MSRTTLVCLLFFCFFISRIESSLPKISESTETIFHSLGNVYNIDPSVVPAYTLENGYFRSILEIHWKRSSIYTMIGNFSIHVEGGACSTVHPSLNLDKTYVKLMCLEISFQLQSLDFELGQIPVPLQIFPELGFNVDPSSIIIDPFMSKPTLGPWAINPMINTKIELSSTLVTFYGITGGTQKLGKPFMISFPQKVTFVEDPDLELVFQKVDIDHLPTISVSLNSTFNNVGGLKVLKQYSISEQNYEKRDNMFKIVKHRFPLPFDNISPKTIKFFISTDGLTIDNHPYSFLTFEFDSTAVLSTIFKTPNSKYELILAGKEQKQEIIVSNEANVKLGIELVFKHYITADNWQETHFTFNSPSPISGTLKVTSCIEDIGKYGDVKLVPQTDLLLETITIIDINNVNGNGVIADTDIYKVPKKINVDPFSVAVYIYNSKEDAFKPFGGQLIIGDYKSEGYIVLGIFVKKQIQEKVGSDLIFIDYQKNSVFSMKSYNLDVFTTQIIDTSDRSPLNRPYFMVAECTESFEYLNLYIFGLFTVLAKHSFGTSLAIMIGIPRTPDLLEKHFDGAVIKDLKCLYVMKDPLQNNMYKFSEASVYHDLEYNTYYLDCKEDFGDYEYQVLIASAPFKENQVLGSFQTPIDLQGKNYYIFKNEKSILYKDYIGIRFDRNTLSTGKFIVLELDVKDYIDYHKPIEVEGMTILGGFSIDTNLVKPFSYLAADADFTVEYVLRTDLISLDPNSIKFMIISDEHKTFDKTQMDNNISNSRWNTVLNLIISKNTKIAVFGSFIYRATLGEDYLLTFSRKLSYPIRFGQEISFTLVNQPNEVQNNGKMRVSTTNYHSTINISSKVISEFSVQSIGKFKTTSRQFIFTNDIYDIDNILIDKSTLQCVYIQGIKIIYSNSTIGNNQLNCDDELGEEGNYQLLIVGMPFSNNSSSSPVFVILLAICLVLLSLITISLLIVLCCFVRKRRKEIIDEKSKYISMNEFNKL